MLVFLDFEASSLGKQSYPIEVGWVFEDGRAEDHLIRPASGWEDWDPEAEAIHKIPRALLLGEGEHHEAVAQRMLDVLAGHDLLASAPSWDGKWMSVLLRAAGFPRHSLRLRDTDEAHREAAVSILTPVLAPEKLGPAVEELLVRTAARDRGAVSHRALADAEAERLRWLAVRDAATALAAAVHAQG
ncbi:3'-5' exonuclease [Sphingomonas sp. OTU376]|uniref:3'-5' exonuclease n=1 Tax=Sphingomonas sp. OTU376 TaxID=3043863 RepID=UPI00313B1CF2